MTMFYCILNNNIIIYPYFFHWGLSVKANMNSKKLLQYIDVKLRNYFSWGLIAFSILIILIVLLSESVNKITAISLPLVCMTFVYISIIYKRYSETIFNGLALFSTPFFLMLTYQNGVLPLTLTPLWLMFSVVAVSNRIVKWVVIYTILGTLLAQVFILDSPHDSAIAIRLFAMSLIVTCVIYYLKKFADSLIKQLSIDIETNERIYGTIGHELRTPAATIDMLLDVESKKHSQDNIEQLKRHSLHLLAVLDDMRAATNKNALSYYQREEYFSIDDAIELAIEGLRPLAQLHNITIDFDYQKDGLHKGSTKAIIQIIQNLLKNAILHSGAQTITLVKMTQNIGNGKTRFKVNVIDDGTGIDEIFQTKMFDAFERGNISSDGTGLGLYLCKKIALQMEGGDLRYSQTGEHGSNFELSFVLEQSEQREIDPAERDKTAMNNAQVLNGLNILFVEDSDILRLMGAELLTSHGVIITTAEDGVEALFKVNENQYDLIITDIMMPNCDGFELTLQLRKRGFTLPIIGLTAATVGDEPERLIECGANAVLPKPLMLDAIVNEINKLDI